MKKIVRIISALLVCALVFSNFSGTNAMPGVYAASSKKVTSKEKKNIKRLCKNFETFIGMELMEEDSMLEIPVGKSKNWVFQEWGTEEIDLYKPNMVEALSYMLIKDPAKKVFDIDSFVVCSKEGDWGTLFPYLTLKSVKKKSSNKYVAVFNVMWENCENNCKKKKTGTATFTLKKKKGTYYGFVAKSVKIKKITNEMP